MAKFLVMSDLHLEVSTFQSPATDADIIILAGDIGKAANGIHWARQTFPGKIVVYVSGNHEFYHDQRTETLALMHIAAKAAGVHLLDDSELVLQQENLRILGCTMWTDFCLFGEENKEKAITASYNRLNDFRCIHEGRLGFTPERSIELHEKSLAWLTAKLDEPFDGKTVVVMHHVPTSLSVAPQYKDDILSACFASNLDYLFGPKIDLLIHGHTHTNFDYTANGTRIICNPRGYVSYRGQENFDFNPALVIEL
jgi:predicted phosphodiesterase